MANIKKQKRKSEMIWAADAMREETRIALRGNPQEEDAEESQEAEAEEERPFFPKYNLCQVKEALRTANADGKEMPLHDPQTKYTAKDVGRIIRVAEKAGLEGCLGYIAGVVEKIKETDSGRLYVLLKKGEKIEKEKCWFYSK